MIRHSWDSFAATGHDARHTRSLQLAYARPHLHVNRHDLRRNLHVIKFHILKRGSLRSSLPTLASDNDAIAFCLDSAIADLSYLTIYTAYHAAQELWPGRVMGPVELYVEKAKAILPALAEPHHAVVLVRLLSDEGVIAALGSRSTAGREGPVVGRAIRNTGSRPLLAAEIAEHWPVVMDSCLVRWSLEGQDRAEGPFRNSGSDRVTGSETGSNSSSGSTYRDRLLARARVAFQVSQAALLQDNDMVEACLARVTPYPTAVEALKGCSRAPLMLTSTLPAKLGFRVLHRCGLASTAAAASTSASASTGLDLIFATSWAGVVSRVVERAAVGSSHVQLVTGNLARLEQLVEESCWREIEEAVAAAMRCEDGPDGEDLAAGAAVSMTAEAAAQGRAKGGQAEAAKTAKGAGCGGGLCPVWKQRDAKDVGVSVTKSEEGTLALPVPGAADARLSVCIDQLSAVGPGASCAESSSSTSSSTSSERDEYTTKGKEVMGMESVACTVETGTSSLSRSSNAEAAVQGQLAPQDAAGVRMPTQGAGGSTRVAQLEQSIAEGQPSLTSTDITAAAAVVMPPVLKKSAVAVQNARADARTPSGDGRVPAAATSSLPPSLLPVATTSITTLANEDAPLAGTPMDARSLAGTVVGAGSGVGMLGDAGYASGVDGVGVGSCSGGGWDGGNDDEGKAPWSPWGTLRMVHLAEWSCPSMSFRARALSHQPRTSLLSEHQLAEWLGVTHLDVVMDGVAWR